MILPLIVLIQSTFARADGSFGACAAERTAACAGAADDGAIVRCLLRRGAELSPACARDLERYVQMRRQAAARGGGSLGGFGGPNALGPPLPVVGFEGRYSPGDAGGPALIENKVSASAPVYAAGADVYALSVAAGALHFGAPVTLDSGYAVPVDLYRVEVGAQFARRPEGSRGLNLRASVGAAGDRPFADGSDVTYGGTASYAYPGRAGGTWLLILFYSNNSSLLNGVPIPGVAYAFRTPTLSGIVGLPFVSLAWTPAPRWAYAFSLFGANARAEIARGAPERTRGFAALSFTTQSYLTDDRPAARDRLTLREVKAAAGVRGPIGGGVYGEAQAGRVFGRAVYLGRGTFDQRDGVRALPADWVAGVSAQYLF